VEQPVILSKLEQEYLLRAIESSVQVRDLRQLFLWTQGQFQGLLPHRVMVCLHYGADASLLRIEPLHGCVLDSGALRRLCDPHTGLAPRIAAFCAANQLLPCTGGEGGQLLPFLDEIDACGYDNVLVHGSGRLAGGGTAFVLLGLPQRPGARQAYFMQLLLPHLHLALLRLSAHAGRVAATPSAPQRSVSARESEILAYLREGKSNAEIAAILGLSSLTVKNHLQRIYRVLEVGNRTQAVARSHALRLLPEGLQQ